MEHLLSVLIYHPAEVRITCDFGTCDGVAFIYCYCNGIVYFYLAFLLFVPRKEIEFLAVYLNICGAVFFIAVCLIAEEMPDLYKQAILMRRLDNDKPKKYKSEYEDDKDKTTVEKMLDGMDGSDDPSDIMTDLLDSTDK